MVEEREPEEVKAALDAGEDLQIVDIRQPEEYSRGHLPGALNLPLDRLPAEVQDHEWGDDVLVVCPIGESSIQAARLLQSYEGVDEDARVASLAGGYAAWEHELETDGAEAADAP
ncbi:MAG: rhodanese-like domain-containing protein [Halobacteriales archaeon]